MTGFVTRGRAVLGVLLVALALAVPGAALPTAAATVPARQATATRAVTPHTPTARTGAGSWWGRSIRYAETLPSGWTWSLDTAVATWNAAGGRVRFVRAADPRRAQLLIGYGATSGAPSSSSLGATRRAFVHLSPSFASQDTGVATNRVRVMELLAHELGHVLGFTAPTARCALMAPSVDPAGCGVVTPSRPGYYRCRLIDTGLEQAFVRRYGGRVRYPSSTWCLLDPLPSSIAGVGFSGGAVSPLVVRWSRPAYLPTGSLARISVWDAVTCGAVPAGAARSYVAASSRSWTDTNPTREAGPSCVQVALVNRFGAASAPVTRRVARYVAPPDAPTVGDLAYDQATGTFSGPVSSPNGTTVGYRLTDDATDCSTWPEAGLVAVTGGSVAFSVPAPTACIAFFSEDHGRHSVATVRHLAAPVPGDAPTVGSVTLPAGGWPTWVVAAVAPDSTRTLAGSVVPGACPATAPDGLVWTTIIPTAGYPTDTYPVASPGPGPDCALFTALDRFGRPGPVVMRPFTDAGPEAPAAGAPAYDLASGTFGVTLSKPGGYDLVAAYDPAHPTVCPTSWSSGDPQVPTTYADGVATLAPTDEQTCVALFYRGAAQQAPWTDDDRLGAPADVTLVVPPPNAPTMGTATYDAPNHTFTATTAHDANTTLRYAGTPDSEDCTTAASYPIYREAAGIATFFVPASHACEVFYAVDRWGRVSPPTVQHLTVPLPDETPTSDSPVLVRGSWPVYQFTADVTEPQNEVGFATMSGACPATAPSGTRWKIWTNQGPGVAADQFLLFSRGPGLNCLMVTAVDYLSDNANSASYDPDHHGAVVMHEFTDDGPLPPDVVSTSYDAASNTSVLATNVPWNYQVLASYDASDPAHCPAVWSSGDAQVPTHDNVRYTDNLSFTPPTPDTCISFFLQAPDRGAPWTAADRISPPTFVHVVVPLPTETPTVSSPVQYRFTWPFYTFTADVTQPQDKVGYWFQQGPCPQSAPAGTEFEMGRATYGSTDQFPLVSYGPGVNCLMVTALDHYSAYDSGTNTPNPHYPDHHGPVVMREYTDAGPPPPDVIDTAYDAGSNTFTLTTHILSDFPVLATFDAADPTTCPETWSSSDTQVVLDQHPSNDGTNEGTETFTAPTPDTCVSFFYEGPDQSSRSLWTGPTSGRFSVATPVRFTVPPS